MSERLDIGLFLVGCGTFGASFTVHGAARTALLAVALAAFTVGLLARFARWA